MRGLVRSFAIEDKVITRLARHQREWRGPPMRATFLASADMQHNPLARRDERREFERFSLHRPRRIGAGRRARTGDDCKARVAGIDNEARVSERSGKIVRMARVEPGDDERAPGGEPDINGAAVSRFPRQKAQIIGRHTAQRWRHADASSGAEPVDAEKILKHRMAARRRRRCGMRKAGDGE